MSTIAYLYPDGRGGESGGGMTAVPEGMSIEEAVAYVFRETRHSFGGSPSQITAIKVGGGLNDPWTPVSEEMSDRAKKEAR